MGRVMREEDSGTQEEEYREGTVQRDRAEG